MRRNEELSFYSSLIILPRLSQLEPPFKPEEGSVNIQENAMAADMMDALETAPAEEPDKVKPEDQVKFKVRLTE